MARSLTLPICVLLLLLVVLPAPPVRAGKAEALAKIEKLLEEGHLDEAKALIDHLLAHNPGDADLLRLREVWRVRKGKLGELLAEEDLERPEKREVLRDLCWRIVEATAPGNAEEWDALLRAGDDERAKKLLERRRESGNEEEKRVAARLLSPEARERPTAEALVAELRKGPAEALAALRVAEEDRVAAAKPYAKQILAKAGDPELRFAAAAVLLALGDEGPRTALEKALHSSRPVDAVEAGRVLFRHPGKSKRAGRELFERIRDDEAVLRAKSALLAIGIASIGASGEDGALEFLTGLLDDADHRVDAARALGVLGDAAAVPALLAYLRAPPPEEEDATSAGLGYLGRKTGIREAEATEEVRPALVGALSVLSVTREGG
jgi:hypothetical protein